MNKVTGSWLDNGGIEAEMREHLLNREREREGRGM